MRLINPKVYNLSLASLVKLWSPKGIRMRSLHQFIYCLMFYKDNYAAQESIKLAMNSGEYLRIKKALEKEPHI